MSFQYSKIKGLALLTSRRFNKQAYGQDLPISEPVLVSTAFATSNLATFVKKPLYKSTPRRRKQEGRAAEEDTEITTSHRGKGVLSSSPSPSIPPPHSYRHLLVISISTNI
jgi:hypothetical protein